MASADSDLYVAMGIMVYALYIYHWRASAIRKRGSGPYDDRLGPVSCFTIIHSTCTHNLCQSIDDTMYRLI